MSTTIDAGGRVVIPKPLRDALGMHPGTRVDVEIRDGLLVLVPHGATIALVERAGRLVGVAEEDLPPLTAEVVRAALEGTRR